MTITKFGHSCLLVEEGGVRILTDPGVFSTVPEDLDRLDVILLTHEHPDHTDPATLKRLLAASPKMTIFTNHGVGAVLTKESIPFQLLEAGQATTVDGVPIEVFGAEHERIVPTVPPVANTGYLIANRLFVPGDAFTVPSKPVEILALPIAAPWCKTSEVLAYALAVKPKLAIPIHDGFLTTNNRFELWVQRALPDHNIEVRVLDTGVPVEV